MRGIILGLVLMIGASAVWAANKSPASCEPKIVHMVQIIKRDYVADSVIARKSHEEMMVQLDGLADGIKPASDVFVQLEGARLVVSGKASYNVPSYDVAYALWDKARALGYNVRLSTKTLAPRGKCTS